LQNSPSQPPAQVTRVIVSYSQDPLSEQKPLTFFFSDESSQKGGRSCGQLGMKKHTPVLLSQASVVHALLSLHTCGV
jgi:hypothetical protein